MRLQDIVVSVAINHQILDLVNTAFLIFNQIPSSIPSAYLANKCHTKFSSSTHDALAVNITIVIPNGASLLVATTVTNPSSHQASCYRTATAHAKGQATSPDAAGVYRTWLW